MNPAKPSPAARLLHWLSDAVFAHPAWFLWPQIALAAACIWVTATIGAAAGLAVWPLIIGGLSLAMLVLFAGAPLERRIRERARLTPAEADRKDAERKP